MLESWLAVAEVNNDLVEAVCVQDYQRFRCGIDAVGLGRMTKLNDQAEVCKGSFLEKNALPVLF